MYLVFKYICKKYLVFKYILSMYLVFKYKKKYLVPSSGLFNNLFKYTLHCYEVCSAGTLSQFSKLFF